MYRETQFGFPEPVCYTLTQSKHSKQWQLCASGTLFNSKCNFPQPPPQPLSNHSITDNPPFYRHALVDRLIRRPFVRQRFCIVVRRVLSFNNVSFSPYRPGLPLLDRHPLSSSISTTSSIHNHPFFFTPLYTHIVFSSLSYCTSYNAHIS